MSDEPKKPPTLFGYPVVSQGRSLDTGKITLGGLMDLRRKMEELRPLPMLMEFKGTMEEFLLELGRQGVKVVDGRADVVVPGTFQMRVAAAHVVEDVPRNRVLIGDRDLIEKELE